MDLIKRFSVRETPTNIVRVKDSYYSVLSEGPNLSFVDLETDRRLTLNTGSQVEGVHEIHIASHANRIVIGYIDNIFIFDSDFNFSLRIPDQSTRKIYIEADMIKVRGGININIDTRGVFTNSTDIIESDNVVITYDDIFVNGVKLTHTDLPETNVYAFVRDNLILLAGFDSSDNHHHYLIDKQDMRLLGVFDKQHGHKVGGYLVHRGEMIDPFTLRKKRFPGAIDINFLGDNLYAIISDTNVSIVRDMPITINPNFTDMSVTTE